MKSGWKTTEFWVTLLIVAGAGMGWLAQQTEDGGIVALAAGALSAAAYAISRGLAKKGGSDEKRDEIIDALLDSNAALLPKHRVRKNPGGSEAGGDSAG